MSKNKKHEHGEHTEEEVLKTECPKCEQNSDKQTKEETAQGEQNQAEKKVENLSAAEKKLAECEKKLEETEKKAEEYKQSWYRSAAEFENYKKRHNGERAQAYADGQGDVIKSILVIGDNLERALASVPDEKTAEGIRMMIRQFYETLANLNVKVVDPVGETFDPNLHEAVHQVEPGDGDESGKIKSVFRKGYELNGKILRYAQVVVIK